MASSGLVQKFGSSTKYRSFKELYLNKLRCRGIFVQSCLIPRIGDLMNLRESHRSRLPGEQNRPAPSSGRKFLGRRRASPGAKMAAGKSEPLMKG